MVDIPDKPLIVYPTAWEYRIIGGDADALRAAVREVFAGVDHVVKEGNVSRQGRWRSLSVELTVRTEAEREGLHQALRAHAAVRMVL